MRRAAPALLLAVVGLVAVAAAWPHQRPSSAAPARPDPTWAAAHAADLLAGHPLRTRLVGRDGTVLATGEVGPGRSRLAVGDAVADVADADPAALLGPLRRPATWRGGRLVLAGTPPATAELAPDGSLVRLDVDLGDGAHLVTEPG